MRKLHFLPFPDQQQQGKKTCIIFTRKLGNQIIHNIFFQFAEQPYFEFFAAFY